MGVEEIHYLLFSTKSHICCPGLSAFFESDNVWFVEELRRRMKKMRWNSLSSQLLFLCLYFPLWLKERPWGFEHQVSKNKGTKAKPIRDILVCVCVKERETVCDREVRERERSRCVYEEQNNVESEWVWGEGIRRKDCKQEENPLRLYTEIYIQRQKRQQRLLTLGFVCCTFIISSWQCSELKFWRKCKYYNIFFFFAVAFWKCITVTSPPPYCADIKVQHVSYTKNSNTSII